MKKQKYRDVRLKIGYSDADDEVVAGVYTIRCLANGMVYIGSSHHVIHRLACHLYGLKGGYHPKKMMVDNYKFYGEKSFLFRVEHIEKDKNKRMQKEQSLIDEWDVLGITYNLQKPKKVNLNNVYY